MISTFKCSDTEALFNGKRVARFVNIQVVALRKLAILNRVGQWSIRINDQWRVCFRFEGGHACDVEIVDYQ